LEARLKEQPLSRPCSPDAIMEQDSTNQAT